MSNRALGLISHSCGHQTPAPGRDRTTRVPCGSCRYIDAAIGPRVVGGRYHCGYWNQNYTVTRIQRNDALLGGWSITVFWDAEPGRPAHSTTHATAWEPKRDRVIAVGPITEGTP